MPKLNYCIQYGFGETDMPYPHPSQLEAHIHIFGEPEDTFRFSEGERVIAWKAGQFQLLGKDRVRTDALRQAMCGLYARRNKWITERTRDVVIAHQGYYWGNDWFVTECGTVITWEGMSWCTNNSSYYSDDCTELVEQWANIPVSAEHTHFYPGQVVGDMWSALLKELLPTQTASTQNP